MLVPIPSSKTPSCPEPSDWHALALLLEVTAQRTRQIQPPILRPFLQAVTDKQTVLSTTHPARFRTTPTSLPDWSWRTEVAYLQREDPTLKPLFTYLVHGHLPLGLSPKSTEHFKAQSTFFDFSGDGLLFHLAHPSSTRGGRELIQQIVVPRALVPKILDAYRGIPLGGGHLAAVKTLSKILLSTGGKIRERVSHPTANRAWCVSNARAHTDVRWPPSDVTLQSRHKTLLSVISSGKLISFDKLR